MLIIGWPEKSNESLTRMFLPNYMTALEAGAFGINIPGDISDDELIMVSGTELVLNKNNESDVKSDGEGKYADYRMAGEN